MSGAFRGDVASASLTEDEAPTLGCWEELNHAHSDVGIHDSTRRRRAPTPDGPVAHGAAARVPRERELARATSGRRTGSEPRRPLVMTAKLARGRTIRRRYAPRRGGDEDREHGERAEKKEPTASIGGVRCHRVPLRCKYSNMPCCASREYFNRSKLMAPSQSSSGQARTTS